jgi:hypothetical protein
MSNVAGPVEALFLIGYDDSVLWADRSTSPVAIPDSATRWQQIWDLRDRIAEITHTHPLGPAAFSEEDHTTIDALTAALGRTLRFGVVTPDRYLQMQGGNSAVIVQNEPWWVQLLRSYSRIQPIPQMHTDHSATANHKR